MNIWFWAIPAVLAAVAIAVSLRKQTRFPFATATAALASAYFYGLMTLVNTQIDQVEKMFSIGYNNAALAQVKEVPTFRSKVAALIAQAESPTVMQLERAYDMLQTGLLVTIVAVLGCGAWECVRRLRQLQSPV